MTTKSLLQHHKLGTEHITKALELEENLTQQDKADDAIKHYKKGVQEFQMGLAIKIDNSNAQDCERGLKMQQKMQRNLQLAMDRLNYLNQRLSTEANPSEIKSSASQPKINPVPSKSGQKLQIPNVEPKLVNVILDELVDQSQHTTFEDVAGQTKAKQALNELVILPALNPALFTGREKKLITIHYLGLFYNSIIK